MLLFSESCQVMQSKLFQTNFKVSGYLSYVWLIMLLFNDPGCYDMYTVYWVSKYTNKLLRDIAILCACVNKVSIWRVNIISEHVEYCSIEGAVIH